MADRIKGITIEIDGNTTKLSKALESVNKSIKDTQSNLKDVEKLLKLDPGNTDLLKQKQQYLADAISETTKKLEAEKDALKQLSEGEQNSETVKAQQNLQREIVETENKLKSLKSESKDFGSVFKQQCQVAGDKISALGDKIKGVGDKLSIVSAGMTTLFAGSVKSASDFETAFTGVRKTVDEEYEGMYDDLSAAIKQMATETGSSSAEIADVMAVAGQLGIRGTEGLTTFTETMVKLGDTTNLSAEEAAESLAKMMNITGDSATDVDKIGSAVVDLGNNFATTESDIVSMATRLASAGTLSGLSTQEILALATAMSSVGIEAEAGGTAMTQTMTAIEKAVADGVSSENAQLQELARIAGMSAQDFADAWENKPIDAIQNFIKGLGDLDESGESATLILEDLGMSGIRQSNMLKSLALASDELIKAVDTSNNAYSDNVALSDEAATRYEDFSVKINQLKESFNNVAIEIGEHLIPKIEAGIEKIKEWIGKWDDLDPSTQNAIVNIGLLVAALGPMLSVTGTVVGLIGDLVKVIGLIATPAGIAAAAIAGIAAALVLAYTQNEDFRNKVNEAWDDIKEHVGDACADLKESLNDLSEAFGEFWGEYGDQIVNDIGAVIEAVITVLSFAMEKFAYFIQLVTAVLNGDFKSALEIAKESCQTTADTFKELWGIAMENAVEDAVYMRQRTGEEMQGMEDEVTSHSSSASFEVQEDMTAMQTSMTEESAKAKENVTANIGEATQFIKDESENANGWGSDLVSNFAAGISAGISAVKTAVQKVAETVSSYLHFSEPDIGPLSNFHTFMPDMIDLMVKGLNDNMHRLDRPMNNMAELLNPINKLPDVNVNAVDYDKLSGTMINALMTQNQTQQNPTFNVVVKTQNDEVLARAVTRGQTSLNRRYSANA